MNRRPPCATGADPRFPYTTLFRSFPEVHGHGVRAAVRARLLCRDRVELCRGGRDEVDFPRPDHPGDGGAVRAAADRAPAVDRSEDHTSELQSLMRISYAVFCLTKKKRTHDNNPSHHLRRAKD